MAIDIALLTRSSPGGCGDVSQSIGRLGARRARIGGRIRPPSHLRARSRTDVGVHDDFGRPMGHSDPLHGVWACFLGSSNPFARRPRTLPAMGSQGPSLAGPVARTHRRSLRGGRPGPCHEGIGARGLGGLGVLPLPRVLEPSPRDLRGRATTPIVAPNPTARGIPALDTEVGNSHGVRVRATVLESERGGDRSLWRGEPLLGRNRPFRRRSRPSIREGKRGPFPSEPAPPSERQALVRGLRGGTVVHPPWSRWGSWPR